MSSTTARTALCALALVIGLDARTAAADDDTPSGAAAADTAATPSTATPLEAPTTPELHAEQRPTEADAAGADPDEAAAAHSDSRSHRHQLGFRIGAGGDGRFAIRYKDGPSCGNAAETFCRRLGTGLLDAELGFGVTDAVEVSLLGRFGLADDAAARALPVMVGLGVRAYSAPHALAKIFFGARAMLDLTASDAPGYGAFDLGLRGEFGVMVDVLRHLGLFAQLGAGIHVLQALNFIGDVTAGVQARFP